MIVLPDQKKNTRPESRADQSEFSSANDTDPTKQNQSIVPVSTVEHALISIEPYTPGYVDAVVTIRVPLPKHCTCNVASPCPTCLYFHAADRARDARKAWR